MARFIAIVTPLVLLFLPQQSFSVVQAAPGVILPNGLTLRHLLLNRHVYDPTHKKHKHPEQGMDYEFQESTTVSKIYSQAEVNDLVGKVTAFCKHVSHHGYIVHASEEACEKAADCSPPCDSDQISCPWRYCQHFPSDEGVCQWRCEGNIVIRGIVGTVCGVLALLAVVFFCIAWQRFKSRYNVLLQNAE